MTVDLTPLFAPRQVAVLGASRNPDRLGHRLVQNFLVPGFPGDVSPVNPSGEAILGRAAVRCVEDLTGRGVGDVSRGLRSGWRGGRGGDRGAFRRDRDARGAREAAAGGPGAGDPHHLGHADARALLEVYGVPFPSERVVTTAEEVLSAAREIGYPLVVKTARSDVLHLDLNPLIASVGRLVAVDALIVVSSETVETGRVCDAT